MKASKNLEGWDYLRWLSSILNNRPLALRGHVTNASFKQWVGILLMPKIDRAHKNYLTPEIWGETHLRETFYGTLIFQQSSIICVGRHVGGHTLALQRGGQNFFLLLKFKRKICVQKELIHHSYAQMCCKRSHINVSTFSLKFKRKICVQKELIHHFKNHTLVTWPTTDLLILRKWCRFENKITIFLFKTWPTNRFLKEKII